MKQLLYILTSKRIDESKLDAVHISLNKSDVLYFNLSTNPIASFVQNGKLYYFRECPKILPFKGYFSEAINAFFESLGSLGISKEHFKQDMPIRISFKDAEKTLFKKYIDEKTTDNGFIKAISKADVTAVKRGFSVWDKKQQYNAAFFAGFGLFGLDETLYDIAVYFLWYMRGAAARYRTLKLARGKSYSFFGAVRTVGSKIVAEELGLEGMIADARFCFLDFVNGESVFGVISQAAKGMRMVDAAAAYSGSLQKALLNLNMLDVISNQPDHGPNNYNLFSEKGVCSVCAFDNDNPQTFFPFPFINRPLAGCTPFIVARPYLDREAVERLNGLNIKALTKKLKPYLNILQLKALSVRIKKLKKAINKSIAANSTLLLGEHDWSEETAKREASGKYGRTYLSAALKK